MLMVVKKDITQKIKFNSTVRLETVNLTEECSIQYQNKISILFLIKIENRDLSLLKK